MYADASIVCDSAWKSTSDIIIHFHGDAVIWKIKTQDELVDSSGLREYVALYIYLHTQFASSKVHTVYLVHVRFEWVHCTQCIYYNIRGVQNTALDKFVNIYNLQ